MQMKLIDKDALVAEIKRIEHETNYEPFTDEVLGKRCICRSLLSFIDTLEVKEIHEDIDVDLNPIFEEFEIDPDSRFASMFKESFYKGIDRYLNKKESKV